MRQANKDSGTPAFSGGMGKGMGMSTVLAENMEAVSRAARSTLKNITGGGITPPLHSRPYSYHTREAESAPSHWRVDTGRRREAAATGNHAERDLYQQRHLALVEFYRSQGDMRRSQSEHVEMILKEKNWDDIVQRLQIKYGSVPVIVGSTPLSTPPRLSGGNSNFDANLSTPKPAVDEAHQSRSSRTPEGSATNLERQLTAFYAKHQPRKLQEPAKIKSAAAKYLGNEPELNAALRNKYGSDLNSSYVPFR